MARSNLFQLLFGMALGGIFLGAQQLYGWESPKTLWAAVGVVLIIMAVNMAELRARIDRLEKRAGDAKAP